MLRTRFAVLAAVCCGLTGLVAPLAASAAPHHNKGLTIAAAPNPILAGEGVLIYGQLKDSSPGGQTILLYHRVNPRERFTLIGRTTTDSQGNYEFTREEGIVMTNRSWFVRGPSGTHSRTVHERVAALVTLNSNRTSAVTRQRIVFRGHVTPDHRFQRVLLQQQDAAGGNGWHTVATTYTGRGSQYALAHAWRRPGTYTLRAYFPGDRRNVAGQSDDVTVTIQQRENPSFTLTTSAPVITYGSSAKLSGVLDKAGTSTPESSTEVTLYAKAYGGRFVAVGTTPTGNDGSYAFTVTPAHNTIYQVRTTLAPHRHTALLFEGVQDVVTANASDTTSTVGGSVTVSGAVSPDKTGHLIYLQRLGDDGSWHEVARSVVGSGSTYSLTYTFGQPGTVQLRVRIYGGPVNVGAASPPVTVTVSGTSPVSSLPPAS